MQKPNNKLIPMTLIGSHIPGHPDMHKLPGVEANTGALGHGVSIAAGIAMAGKLDERDYRVYAITGDGELPEGSNWEAAAAAAKFELDNLVVFAQRRQAWKPKPIKYKSGALRLFSERAVSPMKGAYLAFHDDEC